MTDGLRLHLHDFRYVHEDGRERYGITPPPGSPDGWRRQTRDVYVSEWVDTDLPWPRRVSLDFVDRALTGEPGVVDE